MSHDEEALSAIRELVDEWGDMDADDLPIPLAMWEQLNAALDDTADAEPEPCCEACARPVIQQRAWEKATPNQRQAWLNAGATTLQGRGLCRACYLKAWKAGRFRKRATGTARVPRQKQPCARCGVETIDELCRDCRDVCGDEALPLWESA